MMQWFIGDFVSDTFITEMLTVPVTQSVLDKTCGALSALHAITTRPELMTTMVEYTRDKLEEDEKFVQLVRECVYFGVRRYWFNVFIYCVFGYKQSGSIAISPEIFLEKCFPGKFEVERMDAVAFFEKDIVERQYLIEEHGVLISLARKRRGISHWFNIVQIQPGQVYLPDEVEVEANLYTLYDTVGMIDSLTTSSLTPYLMTKHEGVFGEIDLLQMVRTDIHHVIIIRKR
jgi:hypothetical protein